MKKAWGGTFKSIGGGEMGGNGSGVLLGDHTIIFFQRGHFDRCDFQDMLRKGFRLFFYCLYPKFGFNEFLCCLSNSHLSNRSLFIHTAQSFGPQGKTCKLSHLVDTSNLNVMFLTNLSTMDIASKTIWLIFYRGMSLPKSSGHFFSALYNAVSALIISFAEEVKIQIFSHFQLIFRFKIQRFLCNMRLEIIWK